jgi:hypothetical protein
MSAIQITLRNGDTYFTQDYDTPAEVRGAIQEGDELAVFWFARWGRRFSETLLVDWDEVGYLVTEREIP